MNITTPIQKPFFQIAENKFQTHIHKTKLGFKKSKKFPDHEHYHSSNYVNITRVIQKRNNKILLKLNTVVSYHRNQITK